MVEQQESNKELQESNKSLVSTVTELQNTVVEQQESNKELQRVLAVIMARLPEELPLSNKKQGRENTDQEPVVEAAEPAGGQSTRRWWSRMWSR